MSAIELMTVEFEAAAQKAARKVEKELLENWMSQILNWQKENPEERMTESVLKGMFGIGGGKGKGKGKVKAEAKAEVKEVDRCSAVKWANSKGVYETSRCKTMNCERDDGQGNLLCVKCGSNWDQVSQVRVAGVAISYGKAKNHPGGAPWMGIWQEKWEDSDVPPVFIGQRCCVMKDDKPDINKSFKRLKEENGGNTWHEPLKTWATSEDLMLDRSTPAPEGDVEEVVEEEPAKPEKPVERKALKIKAKKSEDIYEVEGLKYAKVTHGDDVLLYPRWGDDQPDSTDEEAAWAQLDNNDVEFLDEECRDKHSAAVESQ